MRPRSETLYVTTSYHALCHLGEEIRGATELWCVDAVLRLLGVFHDVLYGDVAPVRPGSTLGVVSVRLSRSLFVPGRQLKKGGSPPFPPALGSHTRVATKRRVGFRSPASHTRVATARAERDAPTPMLFFFFTTQICWIPAHCGIEGNEKADQEAKKGLDSETKLNTGLGKKEIYIA